MPKIKTMKAVIGLKDAPESFKKVKWEKNQVTYNKGASAVSPASELATHPAILINKLKHAVVVSYDGHGMMLYPHRRTKIANSEKLGLLPTGITKIIQKTAK